MDYGSFKLAVYVLMIKRNSLNVCPGDREPGDGGQQEELATVLAKAGLSGVFDSFVKEKVKLSKQRYQYLITWFIAIELYILQLYIYNISTCWYCASTGS